MKNYQNESAIDRLTRVIVAEILLLGSYFWLGGIWQIVIYVAGAAILVTALTGFCTLYRIFRISSRSLEARPASAIVKIIFLILFLAIASVGSYYSNFFTRKFFLDDYNRMNNYYKQTLFFTGQEKRTEAITNYDKLLTEYNLFQNKYSNYRPYVLKSDNQFENDLAKVAVIIQGLEGKVHEGDLKSAHLETESIRPIFQDILKRNGFSMLAVNLVDFHDSMEKVIEAADALDFPGVKEAYLEANDKLTVVESIANDPEIQAIRQKLEEVLALAKNNEATGLADKAAELKSAFVKVYLKRG